METVAALTCLGDREATQSCLIVQIQGRNMLVKLPQYVQIGSPVKVEADDTMSLGEVSYCRPEGDDYIVEVELLQALHNVNELSRLARALLT
jgi:hypothetical protein